jgi:hypothetical protein
MQERAIDVEVFALLTGRDEQRHAWSRARSQRTREGWEPGVVHVPVGHDEGWVAPENAGSSSSVRSSTPEPTITS